MSILRVLLASFLAFAFLPILPGQSLDHAILIDDGDPAALDWCFGISMAPDGVHAAVSVCGDIFGVNNDNVAALDVLAGTQLTLGQAGAFPEDPTILVDANGAPRHVYVTNSSGGSVTCLDGALQPVATIPLPGCFGFPYPFGILASPDQTRIYVSTLGFCGNVYEIDSNPQSATFNTVINSFNVVDGGGRMNWWTYPLMVLPVVAYDAPYPATTYARAGFAVVDVSNPTSQTTHFVTPPTAGYFPFATECVVIPGGRVLITIGAVPGASGIYQCDLATGAITGTLITPVNNDPVHGLALSPDLTCGAFTSLHGGTTFFDVATLTATGSYDHGGGAMPNDVVFTPDGSRAVVSLQGTPRVDVLKSIPGYTLKLAATPSVSLGGNLTFEVSRCETGQYCAMYYSLAGNGPQQVGPYTVYLTSPFELFDEAIGDLHGHHAVTLVVPNVTGLSGLTVSTQAYTVDRDGTFRLSNGAQTSIL